MGPVAFAARLDLSRGGRHMRSPDSVPYPRCADRSACLTSDGFYTLGFVTYG
jgi:hypothetical protein